MKTGTKAMTAFLILIIVAGAGVLAYVWKGMQPLPMEGREIIVTIEPGTETSSIAYRLEVEGVIKNAHIFIGYLKYKNEGSRFQAGAYAFNPGVTYDEIIARLNQGDVVPDKMIRFTIPEGYTVAQIADKLADEGYVNKDTFLKLTDDIAWLAGHSELTALIPTDDDIKHPLEGYLFPETYEVKEGSSEEMIIVRMLDEMQQRLLDISPGWEDELQNKNLTLHQWLTAASLIEREVVVDEERPLVAGVIFNRMKRSMRLQLCATVEYVLDKPNEPLYYKDLEIESPYNTYRIDGLPPGPIASPSSASLEAVLHPEPSDYLFYVTKKDGSYTHLFAKTYEEHLKNNEKSKQTAGE
ncbi:endolytic transglycosylase MltG [Paenibacillus popilliae]|uniref:Endolytic murein transglycosylase n=1 Tax=Paenibacillus popilliae ATCC 14706 TaxID=1212764 RepID=M9LBS8_PAEPP|nr:endolytic transglycosylase MltG [Paenibacillus popilliae]GAC43382.1 predicted periplasmic solute-binding protein [Paenibacillus popilliae ATCC 14706]